LKHFSANGGAIPASPAVLAEYLAKCAEKLPVATIERRLTAISPKRDRHFTASVTD
jgi:hypothetical protein